jgi:hypothetical protein
MTSTEGHFQRINVIHLPLIWLDPDIHTGTNKDTKRDLEQNFGRCRFSGTVNECRSLIEQSAMNAQYVLIVSGQFGSELVPLIHNHSNVKSIYVYCLNKEKHEQWAKDYSKVNGFLILSRFIIICFI